VQATQVESAIVYPEVLKQAYPEPAFEQAMVRAAPPVTAIAVQ